jgi:hypothetical protein
MDGRVLARMATDERGAHDFATKSSAGFESSTTICNDFRKLGSVSLLSSSLLLFVPLFVLAGFPAARRIVSWVVAGFR